MGLSAHVQHPGRRRCYRASVVPGSGPGLLNLLVGNSFGDVLILDGKGDGTFQIQRSGFRCRSFPICSAPVAGVLVGDQQNNRVTVQAPSGSGSEYSPVQTLGASSSTSSWRRATSNGRSSTKGRPCPTPSL